MGAQTLDIIQSVVAVRDRIPREDTTVRTVLADAANELSSLNHRRERLVAALKESERRLIAGGDHFGARLAREAYSEALK